MNTKAITDHFSLITVLAKADKVILALFIMVGILFLISPAQGINSIGFILDSVIYIAPYFLLAVCLAAAIKATGMDQSVARIFSGNLIVSIFIASIFGALSPFCSCGVIPLIASMLAAGVPLAPVMSFWIASPIMDPEMFILTSAGISMQFAMAKAGFAIAIGVLAGFSVIVAQRYGLMTALFNQSQINSTCATACNTDSNKSEIIWKFWELDDRRSLFVTEFKQTTFFLGKWLTLAFFIESLMVAFIDPLWIQEYIGSSSAHVVPLAALIGMPSYLNGYAAIPLVGELMDMGMSSGAAMAFMIAGAVSSIPAAIAVYALVKKSIFVFYLLIGLTGSIFAGYIYQ